MCHHEFSDDFHALQQQWISRHVDRNNDRFFVSVNLSKLWFIEISEGTLFDILPIGTTSHFRYRFIFCTIYSYLHVIFLRDVANVIVTNDVDTKMLKKTFYSDVQRLKFCCCVQVQVCYVFVILSPGKTVASKTALISRMRIINKFKENDAMLKHYLTLWWKSYT